MWCGLVCHTFKSIVDLQSYLSTFAHDDSVFFHIDDLFRAISINVWSRFAHIFFLFIQIERIQNKSHCKPLKKNTGRGKNRIRGKQIDFNKNRMPEAYYVGRELNKLSFSLSICGCVHCTKFKFWLVFARVFSIRFKENAVENNNWLKHCLPDDRGIASAWKWWLALMFAGEIIR